MDRIIWQKVTRIAVQICLLAILYAAADVSQFKIALSHRSISDMTRFDDPVQAEQSTNKCAAYTDAYLCTTNATVDSLSCDFNNITSALERDFWIYRLPVCNSGLINLRWTNMPYYSYQFSQDDQDFNEGQAAVVSKCLNHTFPSSLISSTQATATLRTGIYPGNGLCEQFYISLWLKFESNPVVADKDDPNRYFLELGLHRQGRNGSLIDGFGLPSRYLWGSNISDYDSFQPNQWKQITFSFTEFEQFSLMFFAHHNDGCNQAKLKKIHLDLVVVQKVIPLDCPTTITTPTTTTTPNTTTTPSTTTTTTTTTTTPNTTTTTAPTTTTPTTTTPTTTTPITTTTPNTTTTTASTTTTPTTTTPTTTTPTTTTASTTTTPNMAVTCLHAWYANDEMTGNCRCPVSHMQIPISTSTVTCQEYPVIVKINLKMDVPFSDELADSTSQPFKQLSEQLSLWANETFRPVLETLEIPAGKFHPFVKSFRNGSILAEILFRFPQNISQSTKTIRSTIMNANTSLFEPLTINGGQVTPSVSPIELPFDACLENDQPLCFPQNTTECVFNNVTEKSWCQCLPGSVQETPYTCKYDPCGASPCGQNTNCTVDVGAVDSGQRVCECLDGYYRADSLPEEADCEKIIESTTSTTLMTTTSRVILPISDEVPLVLITVLSVVTAVVLVFLIVVCCIMTRRRRPPLRVRQVRAPVPNYVTGVYRRQNPVAQYALQKRLEQIQMEIQPEPNRDYPGSQLTQSDTRSQSDVSFASTNSSQNIYDELESGLSEPQSFGHNSQISRMSRMGQIYRPTRGRFIPPPDYPL